MQIWMKIIIGMIAGIILGYLFGANSPITFFNGANGETFVAFINIVGEVFLKLLKMIVVPLIFFSLCIGIASMEDIKEVGSAGIKLMIYFMMTTAVAITIGVLLALVINPGSGINPELRNQLIEANQDKAQNFQKKAGVNTEVNQDRGGESGLIYGLKKMVSRLKSNLLEMIPSNPVEAMAESRILQVIVFALFFGIGITNLKGETKDQLLKFCHSINEVMVFLVQMIMAIAPFGVCTLMAKAVSELGIGVILALMSYCFAVIVGLLLHLCLVYLPVAWYSTGKSPLEFLRNMREAIILAFSTSSSSATLPVTMRCVEQNVGIPSKTSSFVLPLGATINMDGTALYQGVAVVFISQVFGYELGFGDLVNIILMATLASVGAAGVPGAGMITLVMVLDTVSPGLVAGVALVMGVDRFLDMVRTSINVIGDSTATTFMHKISGGSKPDPKPA